MDIFSLAGNGSVGRHVCEAALALDKSTGLSVLFLVEFLGTFCGFLALEFLFNTLVIIRVSKISQLLEHTVFFYESALRGVDLASKAPLWSIFM